MASINKLSVRGVRSFSPEDAEQVLEFYMPLTVIVGANGCGKTTIIESLKFAVCGALPPGKTAGQAFVHDPRSIGSSVVKSNIKLRFNNAAGHTMVIVRSMEVKQSKTKLNFKQLDGTIRATDQHGQRVSMSHKCTELDRQVPLMLGVSKAILENVVFCHQEDASWPLQEGAVLKKKFDDIFDSTRYTKALDVFVKAKKEYILKAKDHKAVVAELRSHRHAAQGFRAEIRKHNEQMEELEDQLESGRHAIRENKEEQKMVDELLDKINEIEDQFDIKEQEYVNAKETALTRRGLLEEDLTDRFSEDELRDQLRTFDGKKEAHQDRKRELESRQRTLKRELEAIRHQQSELQSEVGRLQASKEADTENRKKRYDKMCAIGTTYGLEDVVSQITQNSQLAAGSTQDSSGSYHSRHHTQDDDDDDSADGRDMAAPPAILDIPKKDLDEYFRVVRKKKDELEDQVAGEKSKAREQEDAFNNELSDLKGKLSSVELRADELRTAQLKLNNDIAERTRKARQVPKTRKTNIDEARANAEKAARARDEANNNSRQKEIPIEIGSLNNKIEDLKKKIEIDRAVQEDLRSTFKAQSAIEQMKAKCKTDLEELKINVSEYSFLCQSQRITPPPRELPGNDTDGNGEELKRIMEKVNNEINSKKEDRELELGRQQDAIHRLEAIVSEKSALHNHSVQSIRQKQKRLGALQPSIDRTKKVVEDLRFFEQHEQKIPTPVAITDGRPDELLSYVTKRLDEIEDRSTENIPPKMVKQVLQQIFYLSKPAKVGAGDDFVCPCCERSMLDEAEFKRFQDAMKKLWSDGSPLLQVDDWTKTAKAKYQEWQRIVKGAVGDITEHQRLQKDLVELQKNVSDLDRILIDRKGERDKIKSDIQNVELDLKELRELSDASKRWVGDSSRIAMDRIQVNEKESNFRLMNSDREGRDLKQVEGELSDSLQRKDEYADKITKLNTELASLNDRVQQASTNATRLEHLFKRMEEKYQEQIKDEETLAVFQTEYLKKRAEQEKLSDQIKPLKQRIEKKESDRTRARNLAAEEERRISSTLALFNNDIAGLQNIVDAINEYEKSNSKDDVDRMEAQRNELIRKAKEKDEEIEKMTPDLNRMERMVDDQERQRKNLEENINLIRSTVKIKALEKEIGRIEKEKSSVGDRQRLQEDHESLQNRNEQLIESNARLEGRRAEINDTIRGLKRKLSQNEYRDVEEDFRKASIRQDTTEMAVKDIEKYHSNLDKALQRYHGIKITEINAIIRDLWNLTYKGEDITNIEIISGNDSAGRTTRSYNYRVVMSKGGGSQMDMRGRCSAGQRVLASIVIRLALAETFCVKFGCISLDEPTVNLDYNNKKGLAVALAQIIASRSQQSNFQLVLITHDEDFVLMLKNELSTQSNVSMPEKYFQIRREEGVDGKYYSKIDAIDWEELL